MVLYILQLNNFLTFNKYKLFFYRLLKINPQHWSDLNWVKITKKLYPGASSKVINTIFHWWITRKVPLELRQDVRGNTCILILFKTKINNIFFCVLFRNFELFRNKLSGF